MPGTIDLILPASVRAGAPFIASVDVKSAPAGAELTVYLEQRRGPGPRWTLQTEAATASPAGAASATFSVALAGPGDAVLVATARDHAGTFFAPDAESVEVR